MPEVPGGEGVDEALRAVVNLVPGNVPQAHVLEIRPGGTKNFPVLSGDQYHHKTRKENDEDDFF